jgi:PBP1b-binding outer membrane lipoprotein LpoB
MKKSIILIMLLMALLAGCTTGVKTPNKDTTSVEPLKAKDFFSFEKDVFMDFKGTGNEYAEYKTYVDYVKDDIVQIRNMNPGTVSVFVYQYKDGKLIKTYSRGETYYLYDYTNLKDKEEVIIEEPIKEGTSWSVGESSTRSITGINKEIDTPSGKYNALEITTENNDSIIKDYYVKGIGKVKSEFV